MVILSAMLKIIASLALGFFLRKIKIMNESSGAALTPLVLDVTCPCMIFSSVVSMDASQKGSLYMLLLVGVIIYAALTLFAFLAVKLLRVPFESKGTCMALLIMGNVGFLGLPLAKALCGDVGLFYMAVLNLHFNIFAFTIGIRIVTRGSKERPSFKAINLINPNTVCAVLALFVYILGIQLPEIVLGPIEFIGQITSPLAMLIIGSTIGGYALKNIFKCPRYYILSAIRLVIFPLLTFFVLRAFLGAGTIVKIATLYAGVPAATTVGMFAITYGGDKETAAGATALMNILCLVTIPLLWGVLNAGF